MAKPKAVRAQPEELLLDYAERLTHHRAGRRSVFIALSALTSTGRPEDRLRLVEGLLAPLVRHHGGDIFRLRSGDVVAVLGSADQTLSERVTYKLRYLFRDDPFVERTPQAGSEGFVRWFDLSKDYDAFYALAREIKRSADETQGLFDKPQPQQRGEPVLLAPPPRSEAGRESALVRFLYDKPEGTRALARLCQSRMVMRLREGEAASAAFEWLAPRADVASLIGFPQGDLERNPELAAALAEAVLRRLLVELPEGRPSTQAIIVDATLSGLLGLNFLSFHKAWSTRSWHPVTFLLPHGEPHSDPERFRYACRFLHELGHRIGVAGFTLADIRDHRLAVLDIDLAVVASDDSLSVEEGPPFKRPRGYRITPEDAERILLDGVNTPQALLGGLRLGLSLFAGRQAQARLSPGGAPD